MCLGIFDILTSIFTLSLPLSNPTHPFLPQDQITFHQTIFISFLQFSMAYPAPSRISPDHLQSEIEVESSQYHHSTFTMDASTSTSASASTSISIATVASDVYDVFINHRGPDVKKTFASNLYRRLHLEGFRVFLDQPELEAGGYITSQIEGVIRTASVHVAVFTPGYAESHWCLDELLHMLQSEAPIIPVFYHVKPEELRWTVGKDGQYAQALQKLEEKKTYDPQTGQEKPRYDSTTIQKWINALSRVSGISGFELETCGGGEEEVKSVRKRVKNTRLNVAKYPTGLDEKVNDFENTVIFKQQQSGKRLILGIVGLGGIGKTTLAKELFNRKSSEYCRSCFITDVKENADNKSLLLLQKYLYKSLIGSDMETKTDTVDEAIEKLKTSLIGLQVLVILDDVDDVKQVDTLLPAINVIQSDSFILITSRNKNVLTSSKVEESAIYNLTGLHTQHSRELFCFHAFSQPHPPPEFEYLVNEFLKACDGLPLSLRVFGALLCGQNERSYWEGQLSRLRQILPQEIQKRLRISYDALDRDEQEIFLDIACFSIKNKDEGIRIWDGSGWNGCVGLQNLLNKSLVQVDSENIIHMHHHLTDLGNLIVKDAGLSRFVCPETEKIDVLLQRNSSVITEVRGIRATRLSGRSWYKRWSQDGNLKLSCKLQRTSMTKLQLLDIEGGLLEPILRQVHVPNLILLRWRKCPCYSLPSRISLKNLRVLQVNGSALKRLWQDESQAPLQLRELVVDSPLSKLPKSMGHLRHLEQVVVRNSKLKALPQEFCYLLSLKRLDLTNCSTLKLLPDSFMQLTNLKHLNLCGCRNLQMLPNSFGKLIRLEYLDLKGCSHLTISSETLGDIRALQYIDLSDCAKIEVLPPQIAHQRALENLKWAPFLLLSTLGRNSKGLSLQHVNDFINLPIPLHLCTPLAKLTVRDCDLRRLSFKSVGQIEILRQSRGQITLGNLNSSIDKSMLELQYFDKCLELQHLHLENIQISEVSFPNGVCPNLQHLGIRNCDDLMEVGTLPKALVTLDLTGCLRLVEVGTLPHTLVKLVMTSFKLKKIGGPRGLAELQTLNISGSKEIEELEELPRIETLVSLEVLNASGCLKLKSTRGLAQMKKLRELYLDGCSELEELEGIETCSSLEILWAATCVKLKRIQGLEALTKLQTLSVTACSRLEELPSFQHLRSLETLMASKCATLKSIEGLAPLTQLRDIQIWGCPELEKLSGVENCMSLERLNAWKCPKLKWDNEALDQLRRRLKEQLNIW